MNKTIANYVLLDEYANLYAGDDYQGNVYVANVNVEAGDRFKHAAWTPATGEQVEYYCAARKRAADFNSGVESYCDNTGESVFYCTCGWH